MFVFQDLLPDMQVENPPDISFFNESVDETELVDPNNYYQIDKEEIYEITDALSKICSIDLEDLKSHWFNKPDDLIEVIGWNTYFALREEYYRVSCINSYGVSKGMTTHPVLSKNNYDTFRKPHSLTIIYEAIDITKNFDVPRLRLRNYSNDKLYNYVNYIIARYIRVLEIALSNPNLFIDGQRNILQTLRAIYLRYSANHDYNDCHLEDNYNYLVSLIKTFKKKLVDWNLIFKVSYGKLYTNSLPEIFVNYCGNNKFKLALKSHTMDSRVDNIELFMVLTCYLEREESIKVNITEEDYGNIRYRSLFFDTEYKLESYKNLQNSDLPELIFANYIEDSVGINIPLFIGTSEYLTEVFLVPSTTQVMDYIRNLYGIPKVNPFVRYGKHTQFLTTPENSAFTDVLAKQFSPTILYVDTVDIRTYLTDQEVGEKPTPFDEWFRFHTNQVNKTARRILDAASRNS